MYYPTRFYKLREIISQTLNLEKKSIKPSTSLEKVFPKQNRKILAKQIENNLGINFKLLGASSLQNKFSGMLILISLGLFFINWKIALGLFLFSLFIAHIFDKFGTTLEYKNLDELTKKFIFKNVV